MKKKLFKYKFVYWLIILINILLVLTFTALFLSLYDDFLKGDLEEDISFIAICISWVLLIFSLILFILKSKIAILTLTIQLTILFLMISIPLFYSIFIENDFGENKSDYFTVPLIYLIIFGFLFVLQKFKYVENFSEIEIDEIGTPELNY